ncbi:MAG: response regulator [Candidatus Methanoperedens sp.]|nr:response regulator [Candidatus Methanoperedens sp.]
MNKPKILVVGEDSLGVELIEVILLKDYEVETAQDIEEIVLKVEKATPDLIILDKIISSMNGFGMCRQLKSDERTRSIPLLIAAEKEEMKEAKDAGADYFVGKPIDVRELNAGVKSLLK